MRAAEVSRAVAAARKVASGLGLKAHDAVVLHNSNKLAVRLLPCDVVARVAVEGQHVAPFEAEIARRLAATGNPVAALDPRVEGRAYERDGFVVTLWTYYSPAAPVAPADYADGLRRLHEGMRTVDIAAPNFMDRVAEAQQIAADPALSPDVADADRATLSGVLSGLRRVVIERGAPEQLLHGEPHPGNVLGTAQGPVFIDLETCCRGPVEFDLAHTPDAVARHYPGADQALLEDCRGLVLAMVTAWRWERGDQFPDRPRMGRHLLATLRKGPPWPTLDALGTRTD